MRLTYLCFAIGLSVHYGCSDAPSSPSLPAEDGSDTAPSTAAPKDAAPEPQRGARDASNVEAHDASKAADAAAMAPPPDPGLRADGGTPKAPPGAITYYQHVKPFMDAKCVRCHVEGAVAPFSLETFELAKSFAKPSLRAVQDGRMPPWKFEAGCNEYVGDFSLTDSEKQTFAAWVEQGTQAGDPSAPAKPIDIGERELSRVDLTLTLPEPYTPKERPDEYRCFPMAWPKTSTAFMTGFRPVPGNAEIVHHIEVYHVPAAQAAAVQAMDARDPGPGYTCFSGPGAGTGTIGGWAPGSPGYDYPDGIGIQIEPGAIIIVQVHYNTSTASPAPDRSKVEMKVDAEAVRGGYNFWTNGRWSAGGMPIPAGNADVKHTWTADPTTLARSKPIQIYTAALHMHNLGRTGYMKLKRKAGGEVCMLRIPAWDFHWQGGVGFKQPIVVQPGDLIEMQCGFDNSAANQPKGADGAQLAPRDVNWGEGTHDEMCLGVLLWGPVQ